MPLSVHLLREPDSTSLARLRANLHPDVRLSTGPGLPKPADYQILVAGRPDRKHITGSPALSALIIPWAGVPRETRALMLDFPDIAVHNLHHNARAVSEMAVALLLAAAKSIVPSDRALRRSDWTPRYESEDVVLLDGKTALILGYGAIGKQVGCLCRGLGMDVIGTRRHASPRAQGEVYPPDALCSLLPQANVLIICLPLTTETEGVIGEKELALLPEKAILVNVGRGPVVAEEALYQTLRNGDLHAAGLDVWYDYPTTEDARSQTAPSRHPFEELDNVVMSPHRAGAGGTEEIEKRRMLHMARLLNAAARGDQMPNRVDLAIGY